jgi:hypothetical protein
MKKQFIQYYKENPNDYLDELTKTVDDSNLFPLNKELFPQFKDKDSVFFLGLIVEGDRVEVLLDLLVNEPFSFDEGTLNVDELTEEQGNHILEVINQ